MTDKSDITSVVFEPENDHVRVPGVVVNMEGNMFHVDLDWDGLEFWPQGNMVGFLVSANGRRVAVETQEYLTTDELGQKKARIAFLMTDPPTSKPA